MTRLRLGAKEVIGGGPKPVGSPWAVFPWDDGGEYSVLNTMVRNCPKSSP